MTVAKYVAPNFTDEAQTAAIYKAYIDAAFSVLAQIGQHFAPHAQDVPNMTVRLDSGRIIAASGTLTSVAAQNTATIVAPVTNPRIDRVVIDASTGAVSVITGAEGASPSAPSITAGKLPVAQIALTTSTTAITNSMITDERTHVVTPPETTVTKADLDVIQDHGTKATNYSIDLSTADVHLVAFSAAATLTISSSNTNDKATVIVKNGGFAITLSGIDNDSPTLTNAASKQDFLGLIKSFGKISCVAAVLNKATV